MPPSRAARPQSWQDLDERPERPVRRDAIDPDPNALPRDRLARIEPHRKVTFTTSVLEVLPALPFHHQLDDLSEKLLSIVNAVIGGPTVEDLYALVDD